MLYEYKLTHKNTKMIFKTFIEIKDKDIIDEISSIFKCEIVKEHDFNNEEIRMFLNTYTKENMKLKVDLTEFTFKLENVYFWDEEWQANYKAVNYLRKLIKKSQDNVCPICGREIINPVLDHMHTKKIKGSGQIRGVICNLCNTFIARSENNAARHNISNKLLPDVLRNMADYFEENEYPILHPSEMPKRTRIKKRDWNKVKKYYFEVYPKRQKMIDKPVYETENWLALVKEVEDYLDKDDK